MKSFENKVALITGSSRGIGKAIAIKLAEEGVKIVLNGRDSERLKITRRELLQLNVEVVSFCGNVSDKEQAARMIEFVLEKFGRLDILINNVGVSNRGKIADSDPDVFRRVFESNVFGTVNSTVYALPHIRQTKGSIIFVSSVAGIRGLPGLGAYCSSKMALKAIAETLRIEEYDSGIHVGLIQVGITEIEYAKEAIAADGRPVVLLERKKGNVQTTAQVAEKIFQNIHKRKFISTLSTLGKINALLQPLFPGLVEKIIRRSAKKIAEKSK